MQPMRTPPKLITLILLTGFSPMSLNMFLPSLGNIALDFETDYATASWAVSGYLALTALLQLIIGPLSDRIGRRPVLLWALFAFVFASAGCSIATSIETFLLCRMLQGGIIGGYVLSLAIVRDTRSQREAVSLIGYIGMAMAVAPMLAPMIGGVMDATLGWRSIFIFYAIAGAGLLIWCWLELGETRPSMQQSPDAPLLGAGALMREPLFWAYALCGAFSVGAFYIFVTGAPLVAQGVFGMNTGEIGFYIGSITMGFMLGGFVAGRLGERTEAALIMIAGRAIACTGLLGGLLFLLAGLSSAQLFFASTVFVGFGNGLSVPASNAGAMSVRPELAGSAAGLSGALVVAGGGVLTGLTGNSLSQGNAAQMLLLLMLAASVLSLGFALWAAWLKRLAGKAE